MMAEEKNTTNILVALTKYFILYYRKISKSTSNARFQCIKLYQETP